MELDLTTNPVVAIVKNPDGSSYALPRFQWDINREQAACDVAEGIYSLGEIAGRAEASTAALNAWRKHPEFQERVDAHRKVFRDLVLGYGIARKETRIAHIQARHDALRAVVKARGEYFAGLAEQIPGGDTGYIEEHLTAQGVEYRIDVKTVAALNDLEKQAAVELGEWNEGSGAQVAVSIVVPASAPDAASAPTVTIGRL